ncbi:Stk1 family PASTA domain-containing Ser/Thr kinase [Periweissella fabalis]|uniref:non-specific serine/threonine protein kinase n=1 Tax=Periweissella fabalis TaxID=1070421 RepID=A0A7X6S2M9_9LACO|nr:Stk1 family PASTA domain-containing Ser/Thr kinase [Periweissella fabalis]MCM0598533.1 Stk1 family PASTA domain-containing Ser/Thr kinase [Periweissella fabalis]NKZ24185.1 Stk1 family PASTA domain-containing Ser/Thr kinase [Periweissella fabalis]
MMPNQLIGDRYRIMRTLGEGGMANVYLAHDLILDRDVSIKTLRLDLTNDEKTSNRFRREALAATELTHPNIVEIYDFDEEDGIQYLVMEYIDGMDLKTYIKRYFPIPLQQVVHILKQVLSAVSAAHKAGIIHRDLKPQNILIDKQGNAKISDFGIAMTNSELAMTQTNTIFGSVHYLSPEQTRGGMATDKSDVYSLGIILYEMLVGKVPFVGENAVAIALQHSQTQIPNVRDFDETIPQALENIVLKATAKDPVERYSSVDAMLIDLRTSLDAARIMEPRFVPSKIDNDETRIIPIDKIQAARQNVKAKDIMENVGADLENDEQHKGPKKHRKRWLWITLIIVILGSIGGAFVMLRHDNVVVPNLVNKSQSNAVALIQQEGLKVGTITKSSSASIANGNVIKSNPNSKRVVSRGTTINLVVSSGKKLQRFGDYTGEMFDDVSKILILKGYDIQQKSQSSNDVPAGEIISQSVNADSKVDPENTTVTFVVSSGPQTVTVPDFTNQDVTVFYNWANQNSIKILQPNTNSSENVPAGKIISQTIPAGQTATVGETMQVTVSSGSNKQKQESSTSEDSQSQETTTASSSSKAMSTSSQSSVSGNSSSVK